MKLLKYRLVLLGLAFFFLFVATSAFIRRTIVESGRSVTLAEINVDQIRTQWRKARIELSGVEAADPRRADRNLFHADKVILDLDPQALLRRRFLVERGRIQGLRVGTMRTQAGESQAPLQAESTSRLLQGFAEKGMQWFDSAVSQLQLSDGDSPESLALSQAMQERWPEQCRGLTRNVFALHQQLASMEQQIKRAGDNPLRNLNPYQTAATSLEGISKQLFELRGEIDRQQQQLLLEQEQVADAIQLESEQLADSCQLSDLDGEALGKYLLANEIAGQVDSILEWLRWGRQFVPALYEHAVPGAGRGQNMIFAGCRPQPDILLKTIVLSGSGECNGEKFNLEGTLWNLSNRPTANDRPTELVVQTTGRVQTNIHAVLDGRNGHPKDRIVIYCPRWIQQERQWGNSAQLALIASGGEARLSIRMDIEKDNQLSGEVMLRQHAIAVTPRMTDRLSVQPLPSLLAEACKKIDHLDVHVKLSGSLDFPKWELKSNFGNELASHLQQTFQTAITQQRLSAIEYKQQAAKAATEKLVAEVSRQHQSLARKLDQDDSQLDVIQDHIAERVRLNDGVVQPESPLRETYRR